MNTTAEKIHRLIQSDETYYAQILRTAQAESKRLQETFRDRSDWVSGWAHEFACPSCTSTLAFDPNLNYNPPNLFVCPQCGAVVSDPRFDEAWVYYYRMHAAAKLESAAVCALLGDAQALQFLERFFDFYADHYAGFAIHGHGSGKLMPQVLDEAAWCIQVLRGFYPCRALFPAEKRRKWYARLFTPLSDLINAPELQQTIHNHVLWHKCAVGAMAVCFEDHALLARTLDEKWGIREQVEKGFTQDGFWREGSVLYHYYALEALTGFCQFFADEHPQDPLVQVLERAYLSPLALSYDQWSLPSINDGWFPLTLERFADPFHRAAMASGSKKLLEQVERIAQRCPKAMAVPAALLIDRLKQMTEIWAGTGLAMLRQPWLAILKSGVLTRSHMHRDYLSVVIPPFSLDLGTPGYGHPMYRSWYQLAAAHNTIAVDGEQPYRVLENHLEETENGVRAVVDSGWDGVISASRTLTMEGNVLHDRTEIHCDGEHMIDWFFHAEGEVQFSAEGEACEPLGTQNGYEYLTGTRRIVCDALTVTFALEGRTLRLSIPATGMEVFAARSPGNPGNHLRTALILRQKGRKAIFDVTYTQGEQA